MTLRLYLFSIAVWYIYVGTVTIFFPARLFGDHVIADLIPGDKDRLVASGLFLSAAAICLWATIRYTPAGKMASLAASLGVACGWTMLIFISALATGQGWVQLGVWLWVIFIMAASVRIPDIPPAVEDDLYSHITRMLQRYKAQAELEEAHTIDADSREHEQADVNDKEADG